MGFSTYWKCGSLLLVLPLYACARLPRQADLPVTLVHEPRYAVARPHANNDYPVSYRVQFVADGHSKAVDQHILVQQYQVMSQQVDTAQGN